MRFPGWKETALWWPEREALIVAEVVGANELYTGGRGAVGMHPMLRALPPRGLRSYAPRHLLMGHGAGIHGAAAKPALERAHAAGAAGHPGRAQEAADAPALGRGGAGLGEPAAGDLDRGGERGGAGGVGVVEDRAGGVGDAAHALLGARPRRSPPARTRRRC